MALHLHRLHHTSRGAARRRVEAVARDLAEELNLEYRWVDDRLLFQRLGAKGSITLDDTHVHVQVSRSPFLPVSEEWLKQQIDHYLDEHLPPPRVRHQTSAEDPTTGTTKTATGPSERQTAPSRRGVQDHSFLGRLTNLAEAMGSAALQTSSQTAQAPFRMVETLLGGQDPATPTASATPQAQAAGHFVRECRQQRDLSLAALASQLDVVTVQQLRAIEAGTARPSLHVMLGLAAHLAGDSPIAFLLPLTRAHYPDIWAQIQALGLPDAPQLTPREERLVTVYRNHPEAYQLSDSAFDEVLRLTKSNFDAAIDLERGGSA